MAFLSDLKNNITGFLKSFLNPSQGLKRMIGKVLERGMSLAGFKLGTIVKTVKNFGLSYSDKQMITDIRAIEKERSALPAVLNLQKKSKFPQSLLIEDNLRGNNRYLAKFNVTAIPSGSDFPIVIPWAFYSDELKTVQEYLDEIKLRFKIKEQIYEYGFVSAELTGVAHNIGKDY